MEAASQEPVKMALMLPSRRPAMPEPSASTTKLGLLYRVDQVVGDFHCVFTAKVRPQLFLGAVAEKGAPVAKIEGRQVPGVGEGEADHALFQHGVQVLDVLLRKDALVIVHEPGVGGEGHAVEVIVQGQGIGQGRAVGGQNLVGILASDLGQGPGIRQGGQGVVGKQKDIRAGTGVLRDSAGGGGLVRHAIDKGDVPFGVHLGEPLAAGLEPFAAVFGLVL